MTCLLVCLMGTAHAAFQDINGQDIPPGPTKPQSTDSLTGRAELQIGYGNEVGLTDTRGIFTVNVPPFNVWSLQYGKFISPNFEVLIGGSYSSPSVDFANHHITTDAFMFPVSAAYHFVTSRPGSLIPYVGAGINIFDDKFYWQTPGAPDAVSVHQGVSTFEYAGLKYYLGGNAAKSSTALFSEYRWMNKAQDFNPTGYWSTGIMLDF